QVIRLDQQLEQCEHGRGFARGMDLQVRAVPAQGGDVAAVAQVVGSDAAVVLLRAVLGVGPDGQVMRAVVERGAFHHPPFIEAPVIGVDHPAPEPPVEFFLFVSHFLGGVGLGSGLSALGTPETPDARPDSPFASAARTLTSSAYRSAANFPSVTLRSSAALTDLSTLL